MADFRAWVADEVKRADEQSGSGKRGLTRTDTDGEKKGDQNSGPCSSVSVRVPSVRVLPSVFVANGALSLLNLCCYLLDRQLEAQAEEFRKEGGFTERLYRERSSRRAARDD